MYYCLENFIKKYVICLRSTDRFIRKKMIMSCQRKFFEEKIKPVKVINLNKYVFAISIYQFRIYPSVLDNS